MENIYEPFKYLPFTFLARDSVRSAKDYWNFHFLTFDRCYYVGMLAIRW